jgi:hypothetical protein
MTDQPTPGVLTCTHCGKPFAPPADRANESFIALAVEDSARCERLGELNRQLQALAARAQSGVAGVIGDETVDTADMVAQRKSLAKLDATLKAEVEDLTRAMMHVPMDS